MSPDPVRVIIADDHPLFLEGTAAVLEARNDIEVVGTARTGTEAIAAVEEFQPDVAVLDVAMPDPDGIALTRRIVGTCPSVRVVLLSASDERDDVIAGIRAGADAYFLKTMPVDELASRLHGIVAGRQMLSDELLDAVFWTLREGSSSVPSVDELSPREVEILELVAERLTNKEIAGRLHLSEQTVKNHLSHVYAKLDVHSRIRAVQRAHELHLL